MTWTTPGYVASGEADSGKFNTETVDNLEFLFPGSGAWTAVTFQNSWVNYAGGFQEVEYRKLGDIVQVRGLMKNGTMSAIAFTLPVGYRPPANLQVNGKSGSGFAYLDVASSGAVTPQVGTNTDQVCNFWFSVT